MTFPAAAAQRLRTFGRPPRIMGIDLARGLAVIGMIIAHFADRPELSWSEPSTYLALVNGRSAILFAVLAGISISLVNGRTTLPERADLPRLRLQLLGRGAAIFLIGVALELLNTDILVILGVYGLLFIAAIPFLRLRARTLFLLAAAVGVVMPFLLTALRVLFFDPFGPAVSLALFGTYPLPTWLGFVLAGMGLGRLRLTTIRVAVAALLVGTVLAAVGYGVGAAVWPLVSGEQQTATPAGVLDGQTGDPGVAGDAGSEDIPDLVTVPSEELHVTGMTCDMVPAQWVSCYVPDTTATEGDQYQPLTYWDQLRSSDPVGQLLRSALSPIEHSGGVFEVIGSGGFAIAVIGLCLLISRPLRWLLLPIAALGSMPLTAYSAQVLIYLVLAGGPQGHGGMAPLAWLWVVLALIAATLAWAILIGRGPLERLLARASRAMAAGTPPFVPAGPAPVDAPPVDAPPDGPAGAGDVVPGDVVPAGSA